MSGGPAPWPTFTPARSRTGPAQMLKGSLLNYPSPSTRLCLQLTLTGMVQDWFSNSVSQVSNGLQGKNKSGRSFTKSDLAYITNISMRHKSCKEAKVPSPPTAFERLEWWSRAWERGWGTNLCLWNSPIYTGYSNEAKSTFRVRQEQSPLELLSLLGVTT